MKKILRIQRQKSRDSEPYWEEFPFETEDPSATVATALMTLPVVWEHSCLQKRCGACAMVINGKPRLACDTPLSELKGDRVVIEPLRKFPVIEDLYVDREAMMAKLKELEIWFQEDALPDGEETVFAASQCLQCGLCLEVCPNYRVDGNFGGMAAMNPLLTMLPKITKDQKKDFRKKYRKGVYSGCGKSLACREICPAGIDLEKLLVKGSAAALFNHFSKV